MGFWFGLSVFLFILTIIALLGFYIYTNILSPECNQPHNNSSNNSSARKASKPKKEEEVVHDYSSGDD